MKKFFLFIIIFLITFVGISCKNDYEIKSYYDENNNLTIEINGMTYHKVEDYRIKYSIRKIGRVVIRDENYTVFVIRNDDDMKYLYIKKSIIADKAYPVFVRDDIYLPQLSEMNSCLIMNRNREYVEFDVSKYYLAESEIIELGENYTEFVSFIKFEEIPLIYYDLYMYYCDGHYYIKNYDNKYVEIEDCPVDISDRLN